MVCFDPEKLQKRKKGEVELGGSDVPGKML